MAVEEICEPALGSAPEAQRHAFRTFLGLPPGTDEGPVCGAILPEDWRVLSTAPSCSACEKIVLESRQNA